MPPPPARPGSLEAWRDVTPPAELRRRRPAVVTIAGVLLIVAGAFASMAVVLIVLAGTGATIQGIGSGSSTLVAAVLAVLEIASGLLVLRRSAVGRTLGIVVAAAGVIGGLGTIGSPQGIVTMAIFGFVVIALARNPEPFRPAGEG